MEDELIKSQIKGREVTYYLTTEDDLNNLKQKGIFADIFTLLFSIAIGGIISIIIAKSVSVNLDKDLINVLKVLNIFFVVASIIFFLFAIFFLLFKL